MNEANELKVTNLSNMQFELTALQGAIYDAFQLEVETSEKQSSLSSRRALRPLACSSCRPQRDYQKDKVLHYNPLCYINLISNLQLVKIDLVISGYLSL